MPKRIYTNVSPKAVVGIRRYYESIGAKVRAVFGPDGEAVVSVSHPSIRRYDDETVREASPEAA